jgi:outer membrane protein assembly factor BamB
MLKQLLACLILTSLGAQAVRANDWPRFRGVDGSGVSQEKGLLHSWPQGGPTLLWQSKGAGRGYGSVAVLGDRLFTLGDKTPDRSQSVEFMACFDREGGKPVWTVPVGRTWVEGEPSWRGARSTPTVDGELACVLGAHGDLLCCDVATGKPRWRRHLVKEFGGLKADVWGFSESVLFDGDRVVCTPGGTSATMVALDKQTGKLVWKCVRKGDRGAGHASIVIAHVGDTKCYLQTSGSGAIAVRADDGRILWSNSFDETTAVAPNPIVSGDLAFFAAGYGRGGALIKQVESSGGITATAVYGWKRELANKHGGVLLMNDCLFGDSEDRGIPFCAELRTGKVLWRKRGSGSGSVAIIGADECLYLRFSDGMLVLAKATSAGYTETGKFRIPGSGEWPSWSHPSIANGRMYLREQDAILCYDLRRPESIALDSIEPQ